VSRLFCYPIFFREGLALEKRFLVWICWETGFWMKASVVDRGKVPVQGQIRLLNRKIAALV
jgi:hypothetical protein